MPSNHLPDEATFLAKRVDVMTVLPHSANYAKPPMPDAASTVKETYDHTRHTAEDAGKQTNRFFSG